MQICAVFLFEGRGFTFFRFILLKIVSLCLAVNRNAYFSTLGEIYWWLKICSFSWSVSCIRHGQCLFLWRIFYEFYVARVQSFLLIDFVLLCILRIIGSAANCRNKHDSAMQSQIVCSGCRSVLLYPRGALEVRCAICSTVTRAAPGTPFAFFY